MDWNSLPIEVWILIWRHLDFETVQKTGTLVSKTWFEGIRSDTILSGELALKLERKEQLNGEEISDILSKWKMLKVNTPLFHLFSFLKDFVNLTFGMN